MDDFRPSHLIPNLANKTVPVPAPSRYLMDIQGAGGHSIGRLLNHLR